MVGISDLGHTPSCFLSYSRRDDEPFVERLRDLLRAMPYGIDVWWDRTAMQSRGVSFIQEIDEAIHRADRLVLVCGLNALASRYVKHELELARQSCTLVVPVLRLGDREAAVPVWLRSHHIFDLRDDDPRALAGLARSLSRAPDPIAPVDSPPTGAQGVACQRRSDVCRARVASLGRHITELGRWIARGAALGHGGNWQAIAAGLVRNCEVRRSYADGIHFVRVGPDINGPSVVQDLRRSLGLFSRRGQTSAEAAVSLAEVLTNARVLVVLDDVWTYDQLRDVWAALTGSASGLLFTSRSNDLSDDSDISSVSASLPNANVRSREHQQRRLTSASPCARRTTTGRRRSRVR